MHISGGRQLRQCSINRYGIEWVENGRAKVFLFFAMKILSLLTNRLTLEFLGWGVLITEAICQRFNFYSEFKMPNCILLIYKIWVGPMYNKK